jgi:predicted dehydrogenase
MAKRMNRRTFIKGSAAIGTSILFLHDSRLAFGTTANSKLNIAIIGCGGKGGGNLSDVSGENIVALCDVNENVARGAAQRFKEAKVFWDYRRMFDKMHNQIDAVVVSTPDHTHALPSLIAMQLGKHVYCEKPLTHNIYEARLMRETARKYKVATQMGNQGTAENGLREAVEIIRAGELGKIKEVHIWSNRPVWPQGLERPKETPPVPPELHWDLWLGPAPARPYHPCYQPFNWRGWIDFGTGAIGDMGCHTMNLAFMALKLTNPISVWAETYGGTKESYPKQSIVHYTFEGKDMLQPRILVWYDGGLKPPAYVLEGKEMPGSGCVIIGEKRTLFTPDDYGAHYQITPADFKKPAPSLPRSPGHHAEWIRACKGGEPAMSNFDYASALTEFALLGNLAVIVGEPIYWDSKRMKAINCPKADYYINTPYRRGWQL